MRFHRTRFKKKDPGDIVKIELKNLSEMEIRVKDLKIQDSTITLTKRTDSKIIKLSEIEKFY